jgi:hypothetical protein
LASPLVTPAAATDLIGFFKSLPDWRMRRGIRYPQWWMPLVASLAIYRFFARRLCLRGRLTLASPEVAGLIKSFRTLLTLAAALPSPTAS